MTISSLAAVTRLTGRMTALLRRPRVHVLLLHHVFPVEEANFRALLQALSRHHQFIAYEDAIRRAEAGGQQVDRPYVAITFDDGFKNCLRAAAIMEEFGARACFFVCPAIVGETDFHRIERFCRERLGLPTPVEFMNWDDLQLLRSRGHEIGGHTVSHVNLARVSIGEAQGEIAGSFEAIKARLGECRHFAWTYGHFSDFSAALMKIVFDAGYESWASGERGCHPPQRGDRSMPLCVRREHIVAGWPMNHALYFVARSSARMTGNSGAWPWEVGESTAGKPAR